MRFIDEYTGKRYRSKEDYEKMIDGKMTEWDRKNWDSIQDRRRVDDDEPLSGRA